MSIFYAARAVVTFMCCLRLLLLVPLILFRRCLFHVIMLDSEVSTIDPSIHPVLSQSPLRTPSMTKVLHIMTRCAMANTLERSQHFNSSSSLNHHRLNKLKPQASRLRTQRHHLLNNDVPPLTQTARPLRHITHGPPRAVLAIRDPAFGLRRQARRRSQVLFRTALFFQHRRRRRIVEASPAP